MNKIIMLTDCRGFGGWGHTSYHFNDSFAKIRDAVSPDDSWSMPSWIPGKMLKEIKVSVLFKS